MTTPRDPETRLAAALAELIDASPRGDWLTSNERVAEGKRIAAVLVRRNVVSQPAPSADTFTCGQCGDRLLPEHIAGHMHAEGRKPPWEGSTTPPQPDLATLRAAVEALPEPTLGLKGGVNRAAVLALLAEPQP